MTNSPVGRTPKFKMCTHVPPQKHNFVFENRMKKYLFQEKGLIFLLNSIMFTLFIYPHWRVLKTSWSYACVHIVNLSGPGVALIMISCDGDKNTNVIDP